MAAGGWPAEPDAGACASGDCVVALAPGAPGEPGWASLIMECSWTRPSSPTTPVTTPSREEGICGDAVLTMARAASPGACTDSRGVPSAAETTRAGPVTGS